MKLLLGRQAAPSSQLNPGVWRSGMRQAPQQHAARAGALCGAEGGLASPVRDSVSDQLREVSVPICLIPRRFMTL